MSSPCPNCGSWSVRHDRSLGGRAVCGACGSVLGVRRRKGGRRGTPMRQAFRPSRSPLWGVRLTPSSKLGARFWWRLFWLLLLLGLPLSLTLAHDRGWLRVPRPLQPGDWPIRTSADVELLLREAQSSVPSDSVRAGQDGSTGLVRDLIASLIAHHVAIVVTDAVPTGAAAIWNPTTAEINLRPSVLHQGIGRLAEVLAHESAHVAQSCRAGGLHRGAVPLGISVDAASAFDAQLRSGLYPGHPAAKAVELEAFSVGARPAWATELLEYYCNVLP